MAQTFKQLINALCELHGKEAIEVAPNTRSCNTRKRRQPERYQQILFATWLEKNGILHYAIPNGGSRNKIEAYNLKKSGVKSGVPDICIPLPNKNYHALYIELKAEKGRVTANQAYWLTDLNKVGNLAIVCYNAKQAIGAVKAYLCMKDDVI